MALTDQWDVTLAGNTGFMLDPDSDQYAHQSVPAIRQQADTGDRPGEQSLNPAGLWLRTQQSWHHGAGQTWLDRAESDPFRFLSSEGLDPWTPYELSMLPSTALSESSTDTNLWLATASGRLYMSEGQQVRVTGSGTEVWGDCTGEPATAVTALVSDGTVVYAGFDSAGVYRTSSGAPTVFTSYATGTVGLVRYAHGRLMAAAGNVLYNIIAAGALPAALYTHPNTGWRWTDIGEGQGFIYASGFSGDKSALYKTAIKADGTALDIPSVAGQLPDGEIARSVTGYLGFLVVGTDKGVRFATTDTAGNVTFGALIPSLPAGVSGVAPVYCAEGQDRFVWYGLTYGGAAGKSGLGRLDLTTFTSDLTPAYAADLMSTVFGDVQSVATYLDRRWFTVSGSGAWAQAASINSVVSTAVLDTGNIGFGIAKHRPIRARINHYVPGGAASIAVGVSYSGSAPVAWGTSSSGFDATELEAPSSYNGAVPEVSFTLTFTPVAGLTSGPRLLGVTLLAVPIPDRTELIRVPLLLAATVLDPSSRVERTVPVGARYAYLDNLWRTQNVVTFQEGSGLSWQVTLDDFQWIPRGRDQNRTYRNGTYVATFKTVTVLGTT